MESIWSRTVEKKEFPSLTHSPAVDAAVIGGGLAGILTAYLLKQRGVKAVVLEASRIGSGQTQNTTAKITSQHNLIYAKLIQDFGEKKAKQYANANEQAIREYRRLVAEKNIDCEFEERPAYLYSTNPDDVQSLRRETKAAAQLGIDAQFVAETSLPFPVAGAVKFGGQAQFHPLKFLQAIAAELTVFEHTRVKTVEEERVVTDDGIVQAKHIIFATHYPFLNWPGLYFLRMHQERSYVLALAQASELDGMYLGIDTDGFSFRNSGKLLLFGGGGHRTGENRSGGKYDMLRQNAARIWPDSREESFWSAQDCMTLDGVPYIGLFAEATPNWYVATGFGKWGMTHSMAAAGLLADRITGTPNSVSEIFSPQRFTPVASAGSLLDEGVHATLGLSRQIFALPREVVEALPAGHGGIVDYGGDKTGVYKDEQGEVHLVSTRCPHLGCQVEWNPDETSWDCPCHGSRFDTKGRLLDNPAQENLASTGWEQGDDEQETK